MLHDLQKNFFAGIFKQDRAVLDAIQAGKLITPEQRLQVYRNNVYLILTEHLQNIFPVVMELVGKDFFRQSAKEFITAFPPASGDMTFYGDAFPKFLQSLPSLSQHPYTGDVAVLEWHYYTTALLPVYAAMSVEKFRQQLAKSGQITDMVLQPHVSVVASPYPVLDIWQQIRNEETDALAEIEMDQPCHLLIYRNDNDVALLAVDEALFAFTQAIKTGKTAEEAVDAALYVDPDFQPAGHIQYFLCNKMLCPPEREIRETPQG